MIIITMGSFAGSVGLAAHLVLGDAGLAGYAAFLVVVGGSVYHAVRSLEAVEVFKEKYEAAYRECTKGIEPDSDQLGPRPLSNSNLMQVHNSPQLAPHLLTPLSSHLPTPPHLHTSTPLHLRTSAPPHTCPHLSTSGHTPTGARRLRTPAPLQRHLHTCLPRTPLTPSSSGRGS
jgi:hypothetical protein